MLEAHLREIFRRTLWTSLAAPLALASGCGGTVSGPEVQDDGGRFDTGRADAGDDSGCGGSVCNIVCGAGSTLVHTCQAGFSICMCGGSPDAGTPTGDAGDPCHPTNVGCGGATIPLSCFDAALPGDGASFTYEQCTAMCGGSESVSGCEVQGSNLNCYGACLGRRPPGMCSTRTRGPLVGRYFADAAQLEAASVDAFDVLRRELEALGAPRGLVEAAATAKEDEVRHARMTARLARRFGGKPTKPRMKRPALRSLEALAIENAVEGCVRETFGALFAMHQAEAADDPHVRATMASIAPDETRHAALGWAVAAWAEAKLDADARARVEEARREAIAELRREIEHAVPAPVAAVAGLPTREVALAMLASLSGSLWNQDAATLARSQAA
jgi:hypothetical protein